MKKEGNKKKKRKEKGDNLDDNEKEQLKKYEKNGQSVIALGIMRKNKLERIIRKERWINVYNVR